MNTLENIELTALVHHFERFWKSQNQEYWFTIPKSQTRLAEKPENKNTGNCRTFYVLIKRKKMKVGNLQS